MYINMEDKKEIRIIILQRGWIYIGEYYQDGDNCRLEKAKVIRRWGTTRSIGQLAIEGKQEGTVLDEAGTVRFHQLTVVATIDCDISKWEL